jgi:uncharacterized protein YbbK (DUF523 family)/uncharacterized protein YbgA (DUF1722 family)
MAVVSEGRPRIGVSACLLGERVRYDAGHKRDRYVAETLGPHVEWVPVCPEVEAGFGTPREPMRLTTTRPPRARGRRLDPRGITLILVKTGTDVTEQLASYSRMKADTLGSQNLSGYIFKGDSPSCGMEQVKVYTPSGAARRAGRGVFAEALMTRMPALPVEEEGRLSDPRLRENFIERVFAYQRLRRVFAGKWSIGQLVQFHTAHELALMAHSSRACAELGQLVTGTGRRAPRELELNYETAFMRGLSIVATPRRHANVMHRMLGYFEKTLDAGARAEMLSLIDAYLRGGVPLIAPLTLIRDHVERHNVAYLQGQTYLQPHASEQILRNCSGAT